MKLGILVNTDRHAEDLIGIATAAVVKGHQVIVFFMNGGARLLENSSVNKLVELKGVSMSYCDYTTQQLEISKEGIHDHVDCGSQYNNATMQHEADRVIVL